MRWAALASVVIVSLLGGCAGTRSSTYRTAPGEARAYGGVVRVYTTHMPTGAVPLGLVEVDSRESLEDALDEFRRRVAELGGDVGLIDRYSTSYEIRQQTSTQSYQCGSSTCTRTVTTPVQVATLHLAGRALSTRGGE